MAYLRENKRRFWIWIAGVSGLVGLAEAILFLSSGALIPGSNGAMGGGINVRPGTQAEIVIGCLLILIVALIRLSMLRPRRRSPLVKD